MIHMLCPNCQQDDLVEKNLDKNTGDITYECASCHTEIIISSLSDTEVHKQQSS